MVRAWGLSKSRTWHVSKALYNTMTRSEGRLFLCCIHTKAAFSPGDIDISLRKDNSSGWNYWKISLKDLVRHFVHFPLIVRWSSLQSMGQCLWCEILTKVDTSPPILNAIPKRTGGIVRLDAVPSIKCQSGGNWLYNTRPPSTFGVPARFDP